DAPTWIFAMVIRAPGQKKVRAMYGQKIRVAISITGKLLPEPAQSRSQSKPFSLYPNPESPSLPGHETMQSNCPEQ
ncbi:MAG: hypothetical protein ACTJG9_03235, partial [Alcaligenes aquatilis]